MINTNVTEFNNNNNDTPLQFNQFNDTTFNSKSTPTLSFATNNVNSLQCELKNQLINDTFLDLNVDFIGLTETRHKNDQSYRNKCDKNFLSFWSSRINETAGVGILIKRSWAIYVQKTFLDSDRFIYIDLYLPGDLKLRVFSIYLHASQDATSKTNRLKLHKVIINHIKDGLKGNFKIVLLGDFNADLDTYWHNVNNNIAQRWRFDFYTQIFDLNFLDLYDICHDTPTPTFQKGSLSSRIDTVFASANFSTNFLYSHIDTPEIYKTDHKIVLATFSNPRHQQLAKLKIRQTRRQVPNLKNMDTSKWAKFAEYTNFHYNCHNLKRLQNIPTNRRNMNTLWTCIKVAINAANKHCIPQLWISPHELHKEKYDRSDSQVAVKKISSILLMFKESLIQQHNWPSSTTWEKILQNIQKIIINMNLPPVVFPSHISINNVYDIKKHLKEMLKSLLLLAKIDLQKIREAEIKQFIDKRCDDLKAAPSTMIDSILSRKKRTIILDRLLIEDPSTMNKKFTVDPDEIKSAAINHYQNFALPDFPARPMDSKWQQQ
jgi:exonuclease III